MLKERLLTAFVLILLAILWLFFANSLLFGLVSLALYLSVSFEWTQLFVSSHSSCRLPFVHSLPERASVEQTDSKTLHYCYGTWFQQWRLWSLACMASLAAATVLCGLYFPRVLSCFALGVSVLFWCWAAWLVLNYPRVQASSVSLWLSQIAVLWPTWVALLFAASYPVMRTHLVLAILLVVVADSSAYFIGRALGKRRLLPLISPNKTRVGLYGALCVVNILALGYQYIVWQHCSLWISIFVSVLVVLAALGDLYESLLKRMAGVKDSGTFLPGHGGLFDRVDAMLAVIPVWLLTVEIYHGFT